MLKFRPYRFSPTVVQPSKLLSESVNLSQSIISGLGNSIIFQLLNNENDDPTNAALLSVFAAGPIQFHVDPRDYQLLEHKPGWA